MANYATYEQMIEIATVIGNNFKEIDSSITTEFDTETSYVVGDIVVKDNVLYKCINPHSGEWNPDDFQITNLTELIDEAKIISDYTPESENLYIH